VGLDPALTSQVENVSTSAQLQHLAADVEDLLGRSTWDAAQQTSADALDALAQIVAIDVTSGTADMTELARLQTFAMTHLALPLVMSAVTGQLSFGAAADTAARKTPAAAPTAPAAAEPAAAEPSSAEPAAAEPAAAPSVPAAVFPDRPRPRLPRPPLSSRRPRNRRPRKSPPPTSRTPASPTARASAT